jgi:hypothetical protein
MSSATRGVRGSLGADGGGEERAVSRTLVLGVVVAPGLAHELTAEIVADLQHDVAERYPSVEWETELTVDRLVDPPASLTEIFDAARRKLLDSRWDIGIVVTDLPLRVGGRPVSRHVSPTHGIAIVSLPALGAVKLRHRLRRTLLELVGELVRWPGTGPDEDGRRGFGRRWERGVLDELATATPARPGGLRILYVPAVLVGNLRLLIGMVRANRPWRFAARLYSALVAALAAGAIGIVFHDHWVIAAEIGWWRLTIMFLLSVTMTIASIVLVHHLWERAPDLDVRDQVVLFNVATGATVAIGILTLYGTLAVLMSIGTALIVTPALFEHALEREVGAADYVALVWFMTSLGTIGGALGAALESDDAVREAAYASTSPPHAQLGNTRSENGVPQARP